MEIIKKRCRKHITCCALKEQSLNDYFFANMKKELPLKHMFKTQIDILKTRTIKYYGGKLIIFISEDENFENVRVLITSLYVKAILVYGNDESKILKILKDSPKYFGISKDFRVLKKKLIDLSAHNKRSIKFFA